MTTARMRKGPPPAQTDGPAAPRRERLVGSVVAGCRIEALLSHDDFTATYAGRQHQPDRPVVLYALSPRFVADSRRMDQLTRDVAALTTMSHEHLLQVIDLATDEAGSRFLITARPQGQPLRELMASVPRVPAPMATVILRQVASALVAAQRRGVLHRGLTPDAITLADGPKIVLGGFGLSGPIDLAAASGPALATALYAAPELIEATSELDARVDIHAVGALIYELVTGTPPFAGASAADVLRKHLREPLVPAHQRVDSVPPALSALLGRMLARERDGRPASLDAVLRDLDQPPANPTVEPPPGAFNPAPAPRATWPTELRLTVGALMALVVVTVTLGIGPLRVILGPQGTAGSSPVELVAERALERLRADAAPGTDLAPLLDRFAASHPETRAAVAARAEAVRLTKTRTDELAATSRAALEHVERMRTEGRLGPALDALREPALATAAGTAALREAIERDLVARDVVWLSGGSCRVGEQTRARTVVSRDFYIDRHEVTNALYARFVAETGARAPAAWGGPTPPAALAPLPVTGVTVREAAAFAAWRGGSLPTSVDWERAARGTNGATFPWGDALDQNACNWAGARRGGPVAPGSFRLDVTPDGCWDLAGNVAELVLDPAPGVQPATALVRGGSYLTRWVANARGAFFQEIGAEESHPAIGFRCVYAAPPGSM